MTFSGGIEMEHWEQYFEQCFTFSVAAFHFLVKYRTTLPQCKGVFTVIFKTLGSKVNQFFDFLGHVVLTGNFENFVATNLSVDKKKNQIQSNMSGQLKCF